MLEHVLKSFLPFGCGVGSNDNHADFGAWPTRAFAKAGEQLAVMREALTRAEDEWLELEALREAIEG